MSEVSAFLAAYFTPLVTCAAVIAWTVYVHRSWPRARALDAAEVTWRRFG